MLKFDCTAGRGGDKQALGSEEGASIWGFKSVEISSSLGS